MAETIKYENANFIEDGFVLVEIPMDKNSAYAGNVGEHLSKTWREFICRRIGVIYSKRIADKGISDEQRKGMEGVENYLHTVKNHIKYLLTCNGKNPYITDNGNLILDAFEDFEGIVMELCKLNKKKEFSFPEMTIEEGTSNG